MEFRAHPPLIAKGAGAPGRWQMVKAAGRGQGKAKGGKGRGDDMVLTPVGPRRRSTVHALEPGHLLRQVGDRLQQLHPSGRVVAEYELPPRRPGRAAGKRHGRPPRDPGDHEGDVPGLGSGWIISAQWANDTGKILSRFHTEWQVPRRPLTLSGQTIFLFNGLMNSTAILQPVLQWGVSGAGGGAFWAVASWFVTNGNGPSFHTQPTAVNEGFGLSGTMTLARRKGKEFRYVAQFDNVPGTSLQVSGVEELTRCFEALEVYYVHHCSDYPNVPFTAMTDIQIRCGTVTPKVVWTPFTTVSDCGQHPEIHRRLGDRRDGPTLV